MRSKDLIYVLSQQNLKIKLVCKWFYSIPLIRAFPPGALFGKITKQKPDKHFINLMAPFV